MVSRTCGIILTLTWASFSSSTCAAACFGAATRSSHSSNDDHPPAKDDALLAKHAEVAGHVEHYLDGPKDFSSDEEVSSSSDDEEVSSSSDVELVRVRLASRSGWGVSSIACISLPSLLSGLLFPFSPSAAFSRSYEPL